MHTYQQGWGMQEAQVAGTGPQQSWGREGEAGPQSSVTLRIEPWNGFVLASQATLSFHSMFVYSLSKVLRINPLTFFLDHWKAPWSPASLCQPIFSENLAQCLTHNKYCINIWETADIFPSPTPPKISLGRGTIILANGAMGYPYLIIPQIQKPSLIPPLP